jgi:plastocyanin
MRTVLIAAAVVLGLAGAAAALARTATVEITKDGFSPRTVTIQSGDAVTWKNSDTALHQVAVDKTSCKLSLEPAQSGSCMFATLGTFSYKDPSLADTCPTLDPEHHHR